MQDTETRNRKEVLLIAHLAYQSLADNTSNTPTKGHQPVALQNFGSLVWQLSQRSTNCYLFSSLSPINSSGWLKNEGIQPYQSMQFRFLMQYPPAIYPQAPAKIIPTIHPTTASKGVL